MARYNDLLMNHINLNSGSILLVKINHFIVASFAKETTSKELKSLLVVLNRDL